VTIRRFGGKPSRKTNTPRDKAFVRVTTSTKRGGRGREGERKRVGGERGGGVNCNKAC
jgi:hypothetical protein